MAVVNRDDSRDYYWSAMITVRVIGYTGEGASFPYMR